MLHRNPERPPMPTSMRRPLDNVEGALGVRERVAPVAGHLRDDRVPDVAGIAQWIHFRTSAVRPTASSYEVPRSLGEPPGGSG